MCHVASAKRGSGSLLRRRHQAVVLAARAGAVDGQRQHVAVAGERELDGRAIGGDAGLPCVSMAGASLGASARDGVFGSDLAHPLLDVGIERARRRVDGLGGGERHASFGGGRLSARTSGASSSGGGCTGACDDGRSVTMIASQPAASSASQRRSG